MKRYIIISDKKLQLAAIMMSLVQVGLSFRYHASSVSLIVDVYDIDFDIFDDLASHQGIGFSYREYTGNDS